MNKLTSYSTENIFLSPVKLEYRKWGPK